MALIPTTRNHERLSELLRHSMQSTLSSFTGGQDLEKITTPLTSDKYEHFSHIMLSVSGIQFRAVLLLHYLNKINDGTLLCQLLTGEKGTTLESDIEPFFMEMGNQLCGEVKRLLHKQFDALGMSTPFIMSETTMVADIVDQDILAECHEFYKINDKIVLGSSLYVFSKEQLTFEFDGSNDDESGKAGELDFF